MGAWAGRIAEEELAQDFNMKLIDRAYAIWDRDRNAGRANEYVNLADPGLKDAVMRDAWNVIPIEAKQHIDPRRADRRGSRSSLRPGQGVYRAERRLALAPARVKPSLQTTHFFA